MYGDDEQRLRDAFDHLSVEANLTVVPPGVTAAIAAARRRRRSRTLVGAGLATLLVVAGVAGATRGLGSGPLGASNRDTPAVAPTTTPPAPPVSPSDTPYDLAITFPRSVALQPAGNGRLSSTIPVTVRNIGPVPVDGVWFSVGVVREHGTTMDNDSSVIVDRGVCTATFDADWKCRALMPVPAGATVPLYVGVTVNHPVSTRMTVVIMTEPLVGGEPQRNRGTTHSSQLTELVSGGS